LEPAANGLKTVAESRGTVEARREQYRRRMKLAARLEELLAVNAVELWQEE
jgi:hypothetical protein